MTHLATLVKFLNNAFPNDLPAALSVCVFSWCPSPISLMWWWCPICMGTLWATCAQAWWVGLASCLGLIMATPMLFLKRWVFGGFTVSWTPSPLFPDEWKISKLCLSGIFLLKVWSLPYCVFQATRNTGKSIAGKNIANPTAMLLASCMMLDHLK